MDSGGADKIVQEIVKGADAQVGEILQEAKRHTDEIRKDAEKKAQSETQAILTKGQQLAERERQRVLADAKMRVKRDISGMKEDLIKKAFGDAEERLTKLADTPEYSDILKKLIVESGVVVGGGSLEVLVRENDKALLPKEALADLSGEISKIAKKRTTLNLSKKSITTMGGAIVRSKNGMIEADNTFESRIDRLRSGLRFEVAEILFGGTS
ncbi:MAG: V-type ATP synthase subunit E [Methanotrichaceae archaeon]